MGNFRINSRKTILEAASEAALEGRLGGGLQTASASGHPVINKCNELNGRACKNRIETQRVQFVHV